MPESTILAMLTELDSLSHHARMRLLVTRAFERRSAGALPDVLAVLDTVASLLALALVRAGAATPAGWHSTEPPWWELLHRLRRHPEPEVRDLAREPSTASE